MQFIFHLTPTSKNSDQTHIWFKQIKSQLIQRGNEVFLGPVLPSLNSAIDSDTYCAQTQSECHIILLTGKKDIFWAKVFKQMKVPPLTLWTGLSLFPEMLDPKMLLPDICIMPDWIVTEENAKKLEINTTLIRTNRVNSHNIDMKEIKQAIYTKYATPKATILPENIFAIQLESTFKNNCFSSDLNFNNFVNFIVSQITSKVNVRETAQIYVSAPNNPTEKDKINTAHFIKRVSEKLRLFNVGLLDSLVNIAGLYQFTITEIEENEPNLQGAYLLSKLVELWPNATYFIPSTENYLLAKSIDASVKGVNIISYGQGSSELISVLNVGCFITSVNYSGTRLFDDNRNITPSVNGESIQAAKEHLIEFISSTVGQQTTLLAERANSPEQEESITLYKSILRRPSIDYDVTPPRVEYAKSARPVQQSFFWPAVGTGVVATLALAAVNVCRSKLSK